MKSNSIRQKSISKLSQTYTKIQYLELSESQFPTSELEELCLLADYSIHPIYCASKTYNFYKKLTEYYWDNISKLKPIEQVNRNSQTQSSVLADQNSQVKSSKSNENDELQRQTQITNENPQKLEELNAQIFTEANQQPLQIQSKVSKNYFQIKKFLSQKIIHKTQEDQKTILKIDLLRSWTSNDCKIKDFINTCKKTVQNPTKNVTCQEIQRIKLGKIGRKDSTLSQPTKTIILGKNQSTQAKQMKHILKVQAKVNFVDQKRKQEQKLSTLQKRSIQLTYLLNIITKQFFNDFSNDISRIVMQNCDIIPLLCMKIIQKIKQQHNFIQIYMNLIKKLCQSKSRKLSKQLIQNQESVIIQQTRSVTGSQIQQAFVQTLQKDFLNLLSQQIIPSQQNFNQYKYQKQIIGLTTFIGKLIQCNILSRKIFKTIYWQVIHRYVEKCSKNPQNDLVNQCLIQGIILISENMGEQQIIKIINKEKISASTVKLQEIQQHRLEQMINSFVNPTDQDVINRQTQNKLLLDSISIVDYPVVLKNIIQLFSSKRLKLKFLVESWAFKFVKITSLQQNYPNQNKFIVQQIQNKPQITQIQQPIHQKQHNLKSQHLLLIDDYFAQLKLTTNDNKKSSSDQDIKQSINRKITLQSNIKQIINKNFINNKQKNTSQQQQLDAFVKQFIQKFLNIFADTKSKHHMQTMIKQFIKLIDSFNCIQIYKKMLTMITQIQFQNLMIIQCDYPYLIDGLKVIFVEILNKLEKKNIDIFKRIEKNLNFQDQDMVEFYKKVKKCLVDGAEENLED